MKFSERWLRTLVDPPLDTAALADALTMAGLEVEDIEAAAPDFTGVVVAQVLAVERHPNADKLSVCTVDAGEGVDANGAARMRTIVCGAPNVAAGLRVPCALPGAELPGGTKIGLAKMRGVESAGMLCSARELGLSQDHGGLLVLAPDAPVGVPLRDLLSLDDRILTIKLTPNLAHCLSLVGVAREVSAITGASLAMPGFAAVAPTLDERLPVRIEAPDLCGRFSGRVIRGVDARAATPDWMRERIERSGQRSVSALVDISNYVMLELGRPSHVFDLAKIHGGLTVRWAREGETLELLNGQTVALSPDVGVIADERSVESLAGIMGGESTAVTLDTTDIYLEAAFWWPAAIAGRARRYNFASEASHRFERGVDWASTVEHIERITALIVQVCGGRVGPVDDQTVNVPQPAPVAMRAARARKVIGLPLTSEQMASAFERLALPFTRQGQDDEERFLVTPPTWRFDISIEEDLIEEVARIHGYEALPVRAPLARATMLPAPEGRATVGALKRRMAMRDWQEAINFSFVSGTVDGLLGERRDAIRLLNPIAEPLDVMRTTLWAGLADTLRGNLNRKAQRVRVFEVGKVFLREPQAEDGPLAVGGIVQPLRVGGLAWGPALPEQWGAPARPVDFFDVKGDLEALVAPLALRCEPAEHPALHPGRAARVLVDGCDIGWLGAMHPMVQARLDIPGEAPVLFELDAEALLDRPVPVAGEISRFPPVVRDLAFLVDVSVPAARMLDEMRDECARNPLLSAVRSVEVFDEYRGKGLENKEKSLAFRVWLHDTRKTLNEEEVDAASRALVDRLTRAVGAKLRG